MFRRIVFWSHLCVGVGVGAIVFVLAATGAILTYEVQITRWAERGVLEAPGARLPVDDLAAAALEATGGQVTALEIENRADAPVAALSGRDARVLLDPATGAVLARGDTGAGAVFGAVTRVHRWLSPRGPSGLGGALTGAANLAFGFLALSGAYLWLPRAWAWGRLRAKILPRRRYPDSRARDHAWHHVLAFWAAVPLLVVIVSGVTLSYDRADRLVMRLVGLGGTEAGRAGPAAPGAATPAPAPGPAPGPAAGDVGLEAILATAAGHDPGWNRITLNLPGGPGEANVQAIVDTGTGRQMPARSELVLSRATGEIVAVRPFSELPRAVRAGVFLRFVHTGEVFGLVGQTVAGLASLAAAIMVYTGLALSFRRLVLPLLRGRRRR